MTRLCPLTSAPHAHAVCRSQCLCALPPWRKTPQAAGALSHSCRPTRLSDRAMPACHGANAGALTSLVVGSSRQPHHKALALPVPPPCVARRPPTPLPSSRRPHRRASSGTLSWWTRPRECMAVSTLAHTQTTCTEPCSWPCSWAGRCSRSARAPAPGLHHSRFAATTAQGCERERRGHVFSRTLDCAFSRTLDCAPRLPCWSCWCACRFVPNKASVDKAKQAGEIDPGAPLALPDDCTQVCAQQGERGQGAGGVRARVCVGGAGGAAGRAAGAGVLQQPHQRAGEGLGGWAGLGRVRERRATCSSHINAQVRGWVGGRAWGG